LLDIEVKNNKIICNHIPGDPALYNGYQGLFGTSGPTFGETAGINFQENTVKIANTVTEGTAVAWYTDKPIGGLNIIDNTFLNVHDGVINAVGIAGWV